MRRAICGGIILVPPFVGRPASIAILRLALIGNRPWTSISNKHSLSLPDYAYPIQSSTGGKPAGLHTNGDSRRLSNSSRAYLRGMVAIFVWDEAF